MESGSTRPKRGGLKGITKNLSSGFSSHVVSALQQLALTPLFLRNYGAAGYGEWLTLSASISYLATLDFGIQTYVNQDLTVRYHRGDMEGLHTQQSTALRMLLGICVVVTLLALSIWLMPVDQWLKMDGCGPGHPCLRRRSRISLRVLLRNHRLRLIKYVALPVCTGAFASV